MKQRILPLTLLFLVGACASNARDEGPPVEVRAELLDLTSETLSFGGPLPIRFQITATNPTSQPIMFRSLELNTSGEGAFALRSGTLNINRTIPPGAAAIFTVSAWGQAAGGTLRSREPVTLLGNAVFLDATKKAFARRFNQVLAGW